MAILSIRIRIGEREYPMKVDEKDEDLLRLAAKNLNDKIKKYREEYGIEDRLDLLSMVAFDGVVQLMKEGNSLKNAEEHVSERISHLTTLISRSLSE